MLGQRRGLMGIKGHWWIRLVAPLFALLPCAAQKTPPAPPSPPSQGTTGFSMPSIPMDHLDTMHFRLDRLIEQERRLTPEPPTKAVQLAELEKILAENRRAGDGRLAGILSGLSLAERADETTFSQWNSAFSGAQTRQAMRALADGAAFLPLSAEEAPDAAAPSVAEQRRIITAVGKYLSQMLPSLPNFRAMRHTTYFEDGPPRELALGTDPTAPDPLRNRPLHVVATSKIQVAYIEGHEVVEKQSGFEDEALATSRFSTAGEFGPILYGVMMDALKSRIVWARWERSDSGSLAVFRFNAAKENSHFSLKPPGKAAGKNQFVAYAAEIAVDPANGNIRRLSVVAQPSQDDSVAAAEIAVEYGRVEIGERFYLCPVHAVALSKVPLKNIHGASSNEPMPLQTQINDVEFAQYHVFRGDPHMVLQASEP